MRLRRSDSSRPGWTRRRRGRGFRYLDEAGDPLTAEQVARCRALGIPPAWTDVWICPHPNGHLQAVGTDAAGRRQYLYHEHWRHRRDAEKFTRVMRFGASLPAARRRVAEHLAAPGFPQERALACAFRILDLGALRVGGEQYARQSGSVGVATLRRDHVRTKGAVVRLRFPGKGGIDHDIHLDDAPLAAAVHALLRRSGGGPELLAWRDAATGQWHDVRSTEVNRYVQALTIPGASAKDFRTWQAAILALEHLAACEPVGSRAGRRRQVSAAMARVAEHLGNTPRVVRTSYVDPRLVDRHLAGSPLVPGAPGGRGGGPHWEAVLLELLGP